MNQSKGYYCLKCGIIHLSPSSYNGMTEINKKLYRNHKRFADSKPC
jgi:hypothetical protein